MKMYQIVVEFMDGEIGVFTKTFKTEEEALEVAAEMEIDMANVIFETNVESFLAH